MRIFLKFKQFFVQVTFNYKQKECLREIYKLLNEYHKEYYGNSNEQQDATVPDDEDIEDQLSKAITDTKQESAKKSNIFNAMETGANGCLFVKASIDEYHELGEKLIRDLSALSFKKTKFTNRMVPIDIVCRTNMEAIKNASGELFDQHFLKEPSTFAIIFNKRLNNDVQREDVIKELASLVSQKNILNKVDLKNAKKTILVEVIKGLCCITVLNDYFLLKKYNLNELSVKTDEPAADFTSQEDEGTTEIAPTEQP